MSSRSSANVVLAGRRAILSHRGREAPTTAMVTAIVRTASSQGQFLSRLLPDEVLGVPVRPVFIALAAGPLLMLAVRCLRPPQRGREVRRRGEGRGVRFHVTWRSLGQLLQQPAIPVRIAERGERVVAAHARGSGPATRIRPNR